MVSDTSHCPGMTPAQSGDSTGRGAFVGFAAGCFYSFSVLELNHLQNDLKATSLIVGGHRLSSLVAPSDGQGRSGLLCPLSAALVAWALGPPSKTPWP